MAKTIMIVDDSASLRQVVGIALRGAGYDVLEASDGKDALGKLKGQKVHLMISDVNMPNMDGISFVKAVNDALKDPKLAARLAEIGGRPRPMTPAEFGKLLADETEKWRKVVTFAGVSVD